MIVPFWDAGQMYRNHKTEYDQVIQSCLDGGRLTVSSKGAPIELERFEEEMAKRHNANYAVGLDNGTNAIRIALECLGVGEGDKVTTVAYTFKATLEAIHHVGADIELVDVDQHRLMPAGYYEGTVIPVNIEGGVSEAYGDQTVHDAAQAITSSLTGDIATFSFYPAKILGCWGDGGALVTNDAEIAKQARLYRHHWQTGKDEKYAYNSRLDNIQAATLLVKLKYLDENIARRKSIAHRYDRAFADLDIELPHKRDIYQDYVILVDNPKDMQDWLRRQGVEVLVAPEPVHLALGIEASLPRTEQIFQKSVRLPINDVLADSQVDYVISKVQEYCG